MLLGVVDLRELVLAPDATPLGDLMTSPVVAAEADDLKDDLAETVRQVPLPHDPGREREGLPAGRDPLQRHHARSGHARPDLSFDDGPHQDDADGKGGPVGVAHLPAHFAVAHRPEIRAGLF